MSRIKQFNGFKVVKGIINNYKCNSNLQFKFKMSIKNKFKN